MGETHNITLSIAKGICILLMVIGHSGCPQYLHDLIYLFHMPCFFFISGYLLKEKYIINVRLGILKRLKGLWWPYVKWSILFLLCHNLLYKMHIYTSLYTTNDILLNVLKIFVFQGQDNLLQSFWFLSASLIASVVTIVFYKVSQKCGYYTVASKYGFILFLCLSLLSTACPIKIPLLGPVQLMATSFYMAGYSFQKSNVSLANKRIISFLSLLYFIIPVLFVADITITGVKMLIYFPIALIGTYIILVISQWIAHLNISSMFDYMGKNTIYILALHFLGFKIISLMKILQFGWSLDKLSAVPVIKINNEVHWIGYTIVGVALPLLIERILFIIKIKTYRNVHG